jgi:hypothetical protein
VKSRNVIEGDVRQASSCTIVFTRFRKYVVAAYSNRLLSLPFTIDRYVR